MGILSVKNTYFLYYYLNNHQNFICEDVANYFIKKCKLFPEYFKDRLGLLFIILQYAPSSIFLNLKQMELIAHEYLF